MTRGERVIAFIHRFCMVPEGKLVGKPIRLEEFQQRFILEVYDNPVGTTEGILSIARKNGKSGLIAAILLAHIAGPEARLNSQIVSGARSRDQAALVFNLAAKMVAMSPDLSKLVRIVPSGIHETIRRVEYDMRHRAMLGNGGFVGERAEVEAIIAALTASLTTPPARSYADGVPLEVAEALLPYTSHSIGCAIYQQSWHTGAPECTCGVEEARAAIRLLSQGGKA